MYSNEIRLMSYEIPFLLNPICNEKQRTKMQKNHQYYSKRIPHFSLESQDHILALYEKHCENYGRVIKWLSKTPDIKSHKEIKYLYASTNAIVESPNNEKRLVKINAKTKYKYSDSVPNKISSNHLIDLYICMECFDVDIIDFIMYRNNDHLNVQTIRRNSRWWSEYKSLIVNLYTNISDKFNDVKSLTSQSESAQ